MKKVLGMGNALLDIMTNLKNDDLLQHFNLPRGSMQLVDKELSDKIIKHTQTLDKKLTVGGSAANTIYGLANLGVETGFIGKVGNDEYGKIFHHDLNKNNIESHLFESKLATGRAIGLISPDSERTFATYLGAAVELSAEDLSSQLFTPYKIIHIEGYMVQNHDLLKRAVELAKENNLMVSLDLASYNVVTDHLDFIKMIVKEYVDIIFANEEEVKSFTGLGPEEGLDNLAQLCEIAVVKIGKKGSLTQRGQKKVNVGVIDVKSLDTTGAGDLYASGFLFGLINDMSLEHCGHLGAILSGKIIEVIGATMDNTKWEEIRAMIKRYTIYE